MSADIINFPWATLHALQEAADLASSLPADEPPFDIDTMVERHPLVALCRGMVTDDPHTVNRLQVARELVLSHIVFGETGDSALLGLELPAAEG